MHTFTIRPYQLIGTIPNQNDTQSVLFKDMLLYLFWKFKNHLSVMLKIAEITVSYYNNNIASISQIDCI